MHAANEPIATLDVNGFSVSRFFNLASKVIRLICADKTKVKLWDAKNGSLIAQLEQCIASNNDGTRVLTKPENDNCAQIWETQTGNCLATLGECTDAYYNGACNVIITSIDVASPAESKKIIKIYDAQTFKCSTTLNVPMLVEVCISPRGDRIIMLEKLPTGRKRLTVLKSDGTILKLAGADVIDTCNHAGFSPSGDKIGIDSSFKKKLFNADDGSYITTLQGDILSTIRWNKQEDTIIFTGKDGFLCIWDVFTGKWKATSLKIGFTVSDDYTIQFDVTDENFFVTGRSRRGSTHPRQ